jgi:hypothetical protein
MDFFCTTQSDINLHQTDFPRRYVQIRATPVTKNWNYPILANNVLSFAFMFILGKSGNLIWKHARLYKNKVLALNKFNDTLRVPNNCISQQTSLELELKISGHLR